MDFPRLERIVFLDMDGVLNSTPFLAERSWDTPEGRWPGGRVDPVNVGRLNSLLLRSGAQVVLSSSWRRSIELGALTEVLRGKGYLGPALLDETPVLPDLQVNGWAPRPRSDEIKAWLETFQECKAFVILDDDPSAKIEDHFVHTDAAVGLTSEDVERALLILGNPLQAVINEIRALRDPVASNELQALAQSVCDTEETRDQVSAEEWARRLASDIVDKA